jgi:UDP-N-acetylmuramoyl-tripeptide--D-alanyl-D-alanine ligase
VKSYNNHTGVPLSLSRMPRDTRFGVFEMGMNHAGELAALTRLVRPHVAIVTTIASAHRAFFASEEEIADAKGEIFQGLEEGGTALIPFDSPHRDRLVACGAPLCGHHPDLRPRQGRRHPRPRCGAAANGGSLVTASLPSAETHLLGQPARRALGFERARRARCG